MRRTYHGKSWLTHEEELYGINLGADFCSEHEWGIKDLRTMLGVKKTILENRFLGIIKKEVPVFGIEARRIHDITHVVSSTCREMRMFGVYDGRHQDWLNHKFDDAEPHLLKSDDFYAEWGENGFVLFSKDIARMDILKTAVLKSDFGIFLGGGGVFSNSGLNLVIISKMPDIMKNNIYKSDEDAYELNTKAEATGIREELTKAGKEFFALSPRWVDDKKKDIKFWLNPDNQQMYNHGLYSIAELKQWIKEEGPIIKLKTKDAK